MLAFAATNAAARAGGEFDIPTLCMYCLAMRRQTFKRLGPLDERFEVGLLEDDDYSMRAHAAGYRVVCAEEVFVHHFGQASFGELFASGDYARVLEANRRRFEEKWGVPWRPYNRRHKPQYDAETQQTCNLVCEHVPPGDPYEPKGTAGMYCREWYAGNPSLSDPEKYCAAAGPFGGGNCGDRCTAFCQVAFSACAPDGGSAGAAPYPTLPKCKTECVEYTFREAGADGGGEGLDGPKSGDTLNCRLYHLRQAVKDAGACVDLGPDAGDCR
jgi:hypothetical protein